MGLLETIFGAEKQNTKREKLAFDELKKKQEEDRLALKQRGSGQQGGGREGLMFGRNQQGVL